MDYKYIEQLLERYWNCETTLEEEQILRTFFSQKDVPASLAKYRGLFCYEQAETAADTLGDDFDARMEALVGEPGMLRARTITFRQRLMPLFKAAAMVAIFLTLGNAAQVAFTDGDKPQTSVADYRQAENGPSVAMGDSAKVDTLQHVPATANILK